MAEGTERAQGDLCRRCYGKRRDTRPHDLNDLSGKEWAQASRSVEQYPDVRLEKQRLHGASFPLSLARQQIAIYTRRNAVVLDPFVGVGTTLDACAQLGRSGIGIDLNRTFVQAARRDLRKRSQHTNQKLVCDDACNLLKHVTPGSIDFVLTSPPYSSLLKNVRGQFAYKWREHSTLDPIPNPQPYSGKPQDLGNLPYDQFLERVGTVLDALLLAMKQGAYAVWVLKDFRDLRAKVPYVNLHGDFIAIAQQSGYVLWDIRIYDQTRYRPLVCLGYPSKNFYLNLGHSYIITLRKP